MSTTYAAYHLDAVKSFDPNSSWIMSSTAKPKRQPPPAVEEPIKQSVNQPINQSSKPSDAPVPVTQSVKQSPIYRTSNNDYGRLTQASCEKPNEWHGRPQPFSAEFAGGMFNQSGLNTGVTKSRIVGEKTELGF